MSVYIGPCNYGTPEPDSGEFITADSSDGNSVSIDGDLDMNLKRIVNLKEPREGSADATTVGYVQRSIGHLRNQKVSWSGGTMTGNLSMGDHKLTVGDPQDDTDAVNKRYLESKLEQLPKPYDLGRYIVFPHADGTETYHGAGSKRHIDLDDGKVFEFYEGNFHNPENMITTPFRTLKPRPGEKIRMYAACSVLSDIAKPWTFIFSLKPEDPPASRNYLELEFGNLQQLIRISWEPNTFIYTIDNQEVRLEVDTNELQHFALQYDEETLIVWVNGVSRKTHIGLTLEDLSFIRFGVSYIGILSLYNRKISKLELVEHFIKFHVKPFTDNEVL